MCVCVCMCCVCGRGGVCVCVLSCTTVPPGGREPDCHAVRSPGQWQDIPRQEPGRLPQGMLAGTSLVPRPSGFGHETRLVPASQPACITEQIEVGWARCM